MRSYEAGRGWDPRPVPGQCGACSCLWPPHCPSGKCLPVGVPHLLSLGSSSVFSLLLSLALPLSPSLPQTGPCLRALVQCLYACILSQCPRTSQPPIPPFFRAVLSFLVRVPGPSTVAWSFLVGAWGRVYGCLEALTLTLTLTPPQHIQALLSGDTQTDTTSFYDRVWAAIRDKYRSEVCGERRGSGPAPISLQKYHLLRWHPVPSGGHLFQMFQCPPALR